jgi:hypothetical protein
MIKHIVDDNKLILDVVEVKARLVYQSPRIIHLELDEVRGGHGGAGHEATSNGLLGES